MREVFEENIDNWYLKITNQTDIGDIEWDRQWDRQWNSAVMLIELLIALRIIEIVDN